ncbi:2-amino-4-hydroxy-6-hydroxymethyldihydropteridine diphosphokinase [Pseudomonas fluorescens]|uniref:2-amino-4-hydroxy-6- hydroxymethyldihydropteridine diphosphokinase n=1 Tax=Pseudomonas fluorescens TaxID=294 RepID=UPI0038210042
MPWIAVFKTIHFLLTLLYINFFIAKHSRKMIMSCSRIFLGLGSNVEREIHLSLGLKMLEEHLINIKCSPVFKSASVDDSGPAFFNLVLSAETDLPLEKLILWIKEIERAHGRQIFKHKNLVTLDIDLLLYNNLVGIFNGVELPRREIVERAYILYPLTQLAPSQIHPKHGVSFSDIWHRSKIGPRLELVKHSIHSLEILAVACL